MLQLAILHNGVLRQVSCLRGPLYVGRSPRQNAEHIPVSDPEVAEEHLLLEVTDESLGQFRLTNLGRSCWLENGRRLAQGESLEFTHLLQCTIGETILEFVADLRPQEPHWVGLGSARRDGLHAGTPLGNLGKAPSAATVDAWFAALSNIQHAAAGSEEFYRLAAQSVCDPGGLDAGYVLLKEGTDWRVAATRIPRPELGVAFRKDLLDIVCQEGRGLYHENQMVREANPCDGFRSVAISPVFNGTGQVVGAIYGTRSAHRKNHRLGVRPLEAQWIQLLADALGAGVSRLTAEADIARKRVLLEQAFSPDVVQELEARPSFLDPVEQNVTVLFMDLRGFTSLAERLPMRSAFDLLRDFLDLMTQQVLDHGGVIID